MTMFAAKFRIVIGAFALLALAVGAQPASAQQPTSVNPQASVVKEQQLLQQFKMIKGLGTIPDTKSYVLEQPAGREWREFRTVTLKWIGGIAILGILALLTIYYLWKGMMRIKAGRSGRKILRFNAFERFVHWLTAVTFVILGITGLNITFGRSLILPWMGPAAFNEWSVWAKFAHNYLSFAFTVGVVLMFFMWVARNLPTRADVEWFKAGGGMFGGEEPPAHKFNGGEKLIFWLSMAGGAGVAVTGCVLLFPFYGTNITTMELAQVVHSTVALLFVGAMLGHIYMGTIGVEGAFEAMGEGTVDVNWAKERHSLWLDEEMAPTGPNESQRQPVLRPAE
jgi:formate dehydrogenase subunit gamma